MSSRRHPSSLAEIASKYYDQNKSQKEIADEIGVTRSAVSRLLKEARKRGIVEIIVHYPYRTVPNLEMELITHFQLQSALVLSRENRSRQEMLTGLGALAARFFKGILKEDSLVAVSWGSALSEMLKVMQPVNYPNVNVVQLVGGMGYQRPSTIGPLLAPTLASILGCSCRFLYAPAYTESEEARKAFMHERSIRETLDLACSADIAMVGIGSTVPEVNTAYQLGCITDNELADILAAGAVGNVCGVHYSIDGKVLEIDINRRVVGLDLQSLSKIPQAVGVSGGVQKAEGILGALRGHYVNVLITDESAARRILELAEKAPA